MSLRRKSPLSLEADPGGEFIFAAGTGVGEGVLYALHLSEGTDG